MEYFDNLHDFNIYTSCRTCLENLNDMDMHYDIFAIPDLQQKLIIFTTMSVEPGDGFPTNLCYSCHAKIEDFYNFQQRCIYARMKFENYINFKEKTRSTEFPIKPSSPPPDLRVLKAEKDIQEDDSQYIHQNLEFVKTEPSVNELDEIVSSLCKDESEEGRPYGEYNKDVKDNSSYHSSRINGDEETLNDMTVSAFPMTTSPPLTKNNRECKICKKFFKTNHTFREHMRLHQGLERFPCHLCDKSYTRRNRLNLHIKDKHERRLEKFLCPEAGCDIKMCTKKTLRQHIRDTHRKNAKMNMKTYTCEECGKVLKSMATLKHHISLHSCQKRQKQKYQCPQCNERVSSKNLLKKHMDRHVSTSNFTCPDCGVVKTSQKDLKKHIKCHFKEKKYSCPYCDMAYYSMWNVTRHKRIVHEGIKSFPCSYCDKSFARPDTRKRHEMTHTGEKPHVCGICNKKFIQTISLKNHQKMHH